MSVQTWLFTAALAATSLAAQAENPQWKVRVDPTLASVGFINVEIDRQINPLVSIGVMAWGGNNASWAYENALSVGVRFDWFDNGVFESGWHTNGILKYDVNVQNTNALRLKLVQTYQWALPELFINAGIGIQFTNSRELDAFVLPAWEISLGRAF